MNRCRSQYAVLLLLLGAALLASNPARAQSAGGACTGGEIGALQTTGNNLYCNSSVWTYPAYQFGAATVNSGGCSSTYAGEVQWTGSAMQYCDGTNWDTISSSAGVAAAGSTGDVQFNNAGVLAASGNLFWNNSSGYLGIGSASPATTLDVNGATTLRGNLLFSPNNTYNIGANSSNQPANIYVGNIVSAGTLSASGSLGTLYTPTGTSASPSGTQVFVGNISLTDGDLAYLAMRPRNASGNTQFAYLGAVSVTGSSQYSPAIVFGEQAASSAYAERMRIDQNGVLGIGTTTMSSSNLLEINGAASIGYPDTYGGSTGGLIVSGNVGIGTSSPQAMLQIGTGAAGSGQLLVPTGTAGLPSIAIGTGNTGLYSTAASGLGLSVNGSDEADFGITSVLQWTLKANTYVSGNATIATNGGQFQLRSGNTILSSPAAAILQLGSSDAASPVAQTLQVQNVVAGTTNTVGQNFTINGSKGTGTGAGGSILFQTAPAGTASGSSQNPEVAAMTIASTGNVGIGTTVMSSSNLVEVNGAASIGYPDTYGGSAGGLIVSGKVGLGTTAPQATLDVNGYARLALNASQPVACSAANQGALALTHLARTCVCTTASTWSDVVTGAACSW